MYVAWSHTDLGDYDQVTLDFCLLCDMNRITQRLPAAATLVSQSCQTLCDPMDCSQPGSSVHGDSPGKNTGVGCHAPLKGIFPTQGSNPGLPHCRWILYRLSHQRDWQWGRNEIVSVMRIAKTLAANLPYNKCWFPLSPCRGRSLFLPGMCFPQGSPCHSTWHWITLGKRVVSAHCRAQEGVWGSS